MIVDLEDLKGNGCLICVEDYTMNYIPFFLRIFIRSHFFFWQSHGIPSRMDWGYFNT